MKVVATSDIHGELPKIPKCDLFLLAGDVCPLDNHTPNHQRAWLRSDFSDWLEDVPADHKVWIAGNHDFACEAPGFRRIADKLPGKYLQDDTVDINDVRIFGTPWVPNLRNWAFYHTTDEFEALGERFPECDIALLHGPPYGVLDFCPGYGRIGAPWMYEAIRRVQPKRVVFGHIHEGYGTSVKDWDGKPLDVDDGEPIFRDGRDFTYFHNVAHNTDLYEPINPPVEFEL